jgi:hypothetical protein
MNDTPLPQIDANPFKTGEAVKITYEHRTVHGTVRLASPNGRSLCLQFEALLGGWAGMMLVFQENDGRFVDLIIKEEVKIERESLQ